MFFLSKLCFLCLSSYKKEHVLIEESDETLIKKKLIYCLPEINDPSHSAFPKYVCSNCINKLESFYKFKQICLQNNTNMVNYFQTLTSTAGKSYKYLLVKLADIKYQNKQQAVGIDQTVLTVGSDKELRTGENENKKIYIKEELIINETQCVDELGTEESRLLYETENNFGRTEEFFTSEHNNDIKFYQEYVKSIKCESMPSNSDVSDSRNEDILHEDSNSNTKTNKLTETTENKFQCTICGKKYPHKISLKSHLKVHSGTRDYRCSICRKRFMRKGNLVEHEQIHTGIKKHECATCKIKFMHKSNLLKHVNIHTGIRNYECALCKKKFIQKNDLVKHGKIHTGIKNHECAVCKRKFMEKRDLVKHEMIHTGIKNYECLICKKKFMHKSNLVKHEKIHTTIKTYECLICKKEYEQKSDLIKHEKIHLNMKSYKCAHCKKKFLHKSDLVKHEKIHTGIRNYECAVCKKKFMSKSNLVKHEIIHTGIKNYGCDICEKKFIRKSDLVRHGKIHADIIN